MKKLVAILCTTAFLLVGCGDSSDKNEVEDTNAVVENNESIEVDKGLLNVTITLPASMFEDDEDINEEIEDFKEDGAKEVTVNEDGSITIEMSKSKHKKMMNGIKTGITKAFEGMEKSEEFTSVKKIEYNDDFTKITLEVNKSDYENSFDSFATIGIAMHSMRYNLYNGVEADKIKVTIDVKDSKTEEVFDTITYPDDFNEMKTE